LCKTFQDTGKCRRADDCDFAHGKSELRSTSAHHKTSLCINFANGSCVYGDNCRYAHGETDLK